MKYTADILVATFLDDKCRERIIT